MPPDHVNFKMQTLQSINYAHWKTLNINCEPKMSMKIQSSHLLASYYQVPASSLQQLPFIGHAQTVGQDLDIEHCEIHHQFKPVNIIYKCDHYESEIMTNFTNQK